MHVSYNSKISTSSMINLKSHHKDLGIVVSDDLQWHLHHNHILDKSYKILGMIRRAFGKSNSVITKAKSVVYITYPFATCLLLNHLASILDTGHHQTRINTA